MELFVGHSRCFRDYSSDSWHRVDGISGVLLVLFVEVIDFLLSMNVDLDQIGIAYIEHVLQPFGHLNSLIWSVRNKDELVS